MGRKKITRLTDTQKIILGLSLLQKDLIKHASRISDYCIVTNKRTLQQLVDKGIVMYVSGERWECFGECEAAVLTKLGLKIRMHLLPDLDVNKNRRSRMRVAAGKL